MNTAPANAIPVNGAPRPAAGHPDPARSTGTRSGPDPARSTGTRK